MTLCFRTAVNVWDKIEEAGKRLKLFTQGVQGPKETSIGFLQRLTSAIERKASDPLVQKALIESLALKIANVECRE